MAVPTNDEIMSLGLATSLAAICRWAGMEPDLQGPWAAALGFPGGAVDGLHPRVLASTPEATYMGAIDTIRLGEAAAGLTFFQKSELYLIYRAAVYVCDSARTASAPTVAGGAPNPRRSEHRKVKASAVIDPIDETEFHSPGPNELEEWYNNYKVLKHGDPLEEKDPTPDQIAAMHVRIVDLHMEPYADFSLLRPLGRRIAKILQRRS